MKDLTTYINEQQFIADHPILEMAMVSSPQDQLPMNTKICVYGGEGAEKSQKEPHFHVIINNGEREFEIFIKDIDELDIWRVKGNYEKTWNNYTKVHKAIKKWLDEKSTNWPEINNRISIIRQWNANNPTNAISLAFYENK